MYIFVGTRVIYERAQNRTNYLEIQCIKMLQVWSNWRCVCLCLLFSFKFPFREVTRSKCKRGAAKTKYSFFCTLFIYYPGWNYDVSKCIVSNTTWLETTVSNPWFTKIQKRVSKIYSPCLFCHLQSAHMQYWILPIRHLVKV